MIRETENFHILAHIQADQGVRGVKHIGGQLLNKLRLAYAGGTHKIKDWGRLRGLICTRPRRTAAATFFNGFILADDMGFQRRLQTGQLLNIPLLDFAAGIPVHMEMALAISDSST